MKSYRRRMKKNKTLKNNKKSNSSSLNRKSSNIKTNQKRKSYRRHHGMRGGVALVQPYTQTNSNSLSSNDHHAKSFGTTSYVNSTPQPILDVVWGLQTKVNALYNEIFGHPKQYSSDPTDQPLGKTVNPYVPKPISADQMTNFKATLLNKFNK